MPRVPGMAAHYVQDGCEGILPTQMVIFRVCGATQNFCVFSLYRNPDLHDQIYECLLSSIAAMHAVDVLASFLFMGDLNGHHPSSVSKIWLSPTTMNLHGVAALDFATVSECDQLVIGPTHSCGRTLDLLMTDVTDLVQVIVIAPLGNSDHSSLSTAISMAQAVPNLWVSREVLLKHIVSWSAVCDAIRELPWQSIWNGDNPVEILNVHLSLIV